MFFYFFCINDWSGKGMFFLQVNFFPTVLFSVSHILIVIHDFVRSSSSWWLPFLKSLIFLTILLFFACVDCRSYLVLISLNFIFFDIFNFSFNFVGVFLIIYSYFFTDLLSYLLYTWFCQISYWIFKMKNLQKIFI